MTTQITPIPDWLFVLKEPAAYLPELGFTEAEQLWNSLPQKHGELGSRLQVYLQAEFLSIKIMFQNDKAFSILKEAGIVEKSGMSYVISNQMACFLFHKLASDEDFVIASVKDQEFYREHLPLTSNWIDKQIRKKQAEERRAHGNLTLLEKAVVALKALGGNAVQTVLALPNMAGERVQWNGLPKLEKLDNGNVRVSNLPDVSLPKQKDGKWSWPALNDGSNLLEAPKAEAEAQADDTTSVKEDAEAVEEAPAPAPVEEPKAEEAPPKTKRKPRKSAASKKTAGKGPKRGPDGRFLKKEETPPEHHFRSTGGGSGGGTGC